jgi:hypothetical protein
MDRRSFLASVSVGLAVTTGGCIADGRVALDFSEEVTVRPRMGWWKKLPDVGGNGALSLSVRADQQFDVYYFADASSFNQYRLYIFNQRNDASTTADASSSATRTGTATPAMTEAQQSAQLNGDDISKTAVPVEGGEKYEVQIPGDGGRKSVETSGKHYLVVDHSSYGVGVKVERYQEPLSPFVDLQVIDEDSLI